MLSALDWHQGEKCAAAALARPGLVDLCYNEVVAAVHNMISQLNSGSIIVFHLVSLGELEHARLAVAAPPWRTCNAATAACADRWPTSAATTPS